MNIFHYWRLWLEEEQRKLFTTAFDDYGPFSRGSCGCRGPCHGSAGLCQNRGCRRRCLSHSLCRKSIRALGAQSALPLTAGWWRCCQSSSVQRLAYPELPAQPGSGRGWQCPCRQRRWGGRDPTPARHSCRLCWSWRSAAVRPQRQTPGQKWTRKAQLLPLAGDNVPARGRCADEYVLKVGLHEVGDVAVILAAGPFDVSRDRQQTNLDSFPCCL